METQKKGLTIKDLVTTGIFVALLTVAMLNWSMVFYVYSVYSVRKYRESKTVYTDEGADCV